MKVSMLMVSSLNGKVTNGDNPDVTSWTSPEDAKLFLDLKEKHNLLVMGRGTFEAARAHMKLQPDKLRVVLTRHPHQYAKDTVKGSLEFTDESPTELVARLEKQGYKEMLLLGGSEINALFVQEGLVDQIRLTVEPVVFASGKELIGPTHRPMSLALQEMHRLNENGTLHFVYDVIK
jgi:dihydrofolate reductase